MSLINQMLKDLEARQKNKNETSPLSGLSSGMGARKSKPKVSKKFLMIIVPIFAVVILGLLLSGEDKSSKDLKPQINAAVTPVAAQAPADQPAPTEVTAPLLPNDSPSGPQLHIDKIIFNPGQNDQEGELVFTLHDVSHYYDFNLQENGSVASLTFFNTKISRDTLDALSPNPFFSTVATKPKRYDALVNVALNPGVEVAGLEMLENQTPPVLILSLKKSSAISASSENPDAMPTKVTPDAVTTNGNMTKTSVPPTKDQLAERLRSEAMEAYKNGKNMEALSQLAEGMNTYPKYKPIVETLVTLLIEDRQLVAAQALLNKALEKTPTYIPFVILQGRLYAADGADQAALDALGMVSPTLEQYPDYYALLAAVHQRLNHPDLSEQIYRELVTLDPENGTWWMGYGIALEANGKRNNAIQAYRRAANTGNLSSKLLMYSNSRIEALGG